MKRRFWIWFAVSAAILVLLPWVVVKTVKSDAGFAAILLLLFAVDPVWCGLSGYYAGKCLKAYFLVPAVSAVLFLAGTWLCFEMGETAFILYAVIYLILGTGAMLLSHILQKRREYNG